jgi:DNA-binding YbaB/EbfC family protein
MFGGNMMEKLQQMQQKVEESKARLENITVSGEAGGNLILVEVNGNRKVKKISIHAELSDMDKEDLEDLLIVAINRALEQANSVHEQEMASSAGSLLGGFK